MEEMRLTLPIALPDGLWEAPAVLERMNVDEPDIRVWLTVEISGRTVRVESDTTEDALHKLASLLPDSWKIHSCLTCRHGYFCPIGDYDNEIFCLSDLNPQQKSDLYFPTEDPAERAARSRTLFHHCEQFAPLTDGFFYK